MSANRSETTTQPEVDGFPVTEMKLVELRAEKLSERTTAIRFFESNPSQSIDLLTSRLSETTSEPEILAITSFVEEIFSKKRYLIAFTQNELDSAVKLVKAFRSKSKFDTIKRIFFNLSMYAEQLNASADYVNVTLLVCADMALLGDRVRLHAARTVAVDDCNLKTLSNSLKFCQSNQCSAAASELIQQYLHTQSITPTPESEEILLSLIQSHCLQAANILYQHLKVPIKKQADNSSNGANPFDSKVLEAMLNNNYVLEASKLMTQRKLIPETAHIITLLDAHYNQLQNGSSLLEFKAVERLIQVLVKRLEKGEVTDSLQIAAVAGLWLQEASWEQVTSKINNLSPKMLIVVAEKSALINRDPRELLKILSNIGDVKLIGKLFARLFTVMKPQMWLKLFSIYQTGLVSGDMPLWEEVLSHLFNSGTSVEKPSDLIVKLQSIMVELPEKSQLWLIEKILQQNPPDIISLKSVASLRTLATQLVTTISLSSDSMSSQVYAVELILAGTGDTSLFIKEWLTKVDDFLNSQLGTEFLTSSKYNLARLKLLNIAKKYNQSALVQVLSSNCQLSKNISDLLLQPTHHLADHYSKAIKDVFPIEVVSQSLASIHFTDFSFFIIELSMFYSDSEIILLVQEYISRLTPEDAVTVIDDCIAYIPHLAITSYLDIYLAMRPQMTLLLLPQLHSRPELGQAFARHIDQLPFSIFVNWKVTDFRLLFTSLSLLPAEQFKEITQILYNKAEREQNMSVVKSIYVVCYELNQQSLLPDIDDYFFAFEIIEAGMSTSPAPEKLLTVTQGLNSLQLKETAGMAFERKAQLSLQTYLDDVAQKGEYFDPTDTAVIDTFPFEKVDLNKMNIEQLISVLIKQLVHADDVIQVTKRVFREENSNNALRKESIIRQFLIEVYGGILPSALQSILKNPTVPIHVLFERWLDNHPTISGTLVNNLAAMYALDNHSSVARSSESQSQTEASSIQPTVRLRKVYGISNYARYPENLLLRQLELPSSSKVIVVVVPRADYKGAFYSLNKVYTSLAMQAHKHGHEVVFIEVDSPISLSQRLQAIKQTGNLAIHGLLILSHGNKRLFELSKKSKGTVYVDQIAPPMEQWTTPTNPDYTQHSKEEFNDLRRNARMWDNLVARIKSQIKPQKSGEGFNQYELRAKIATLSNAILSDILSQLQPSCAVGTIMCYSGVKGGVAHKLSTITQGLVSGSETSIYPLDVNLVFNQDDTLLSIITQYSEGETLVYNSGQPVPWQESVKSLFVGSVSNQDLAAVIQKS